VTEGHAFPHAARRPFLLVFCLFTVRRREWVEFGGWDQVGADWILVDVLKPGFEMGAVEDKVVGEASLPSGEVGSETSGGPALDEVHDLRDGFFDWGEKKVGVIGHDDEGVKFVCAQIAVVLEGFQEEFGVGRNLEEAAAIVGDGGDEECAGGGGSLRDGHTRRV
jgi:hypothetical protein